MQRVSPPVKLVAFTFNETGTHQNIMALSSEQKKAYKRIGHHLKPIVMVSENGLSEGVMAELDRALNDHELIKIRLSVADRDSKQALIDELCKASGAQLVQVIGKMAILLRPAKKPNTQLSNLVRYKNM